MTRHQRNGRPQSPFSDWVRNNPDLEARDGFTATDVDWIWQRFKTHTDKIGDRSLQHMVLIEEKRGLDSLTDSQRDTLYMFHHLLRQIPITKHPSYSTHGRRKITVWWWGVHVLKYSDPHRFQDSDEIIWDKHVVTTDELTKILRFELRPDDVTKPHSDRRHHCPGSDGYAAPTLFEWTNP